MAKLVTVWAVAVLLSAVLAVAGQATQNETLLLVTFFTCKLLWFVYLALLLEWIARHQRVRSWFRPPAPRYERRRRRMLSL